MQPLICLSHQKHGTGKRARMNDQSLHDEGNLAVAIWYKSEVLI
jgi:hypothetical protein